MIKTKLCIFILLLFLMKHNNTKTKNYEINNFFYKKVIVIDLISKLLTRLAKFPEINLSLFVKVIILLFVSRRVVLRLDGKIFQVSI